MKHSKIVDIVNYITITDRVSNDQRKAELARRYLAHRLDCMVNESKSHIKSTPAYSWSYIKDALLLSIVLLIK